MKRANVCAALTAVAASATVIAAPTATAAPCNPDHVHLKVERPVTYIIGSGGAFNCSSNFSATLELQRHRWYGWGDTLESRSGTFNHDFWYHLYYDCQNTGTHTYRTIMYGRNVGQRSWFKESNHLRISC